jgi:hypothetical protein
VSELDEIITMIVNDSETMAMLQIVVFRGYMPDIETAIADLIAFLPAHADWVERAGESFQSWYARQNPPR